jgi:RNA polymerase sigma-70 factor (ECF subfamily)
MSQAQLRVTMGEAEWAIADDERELVERAKSDRAAFSVLYRRHYRALCSHVLRRTGDVHTTEDLVSDVFLTALRTLPRYRYRGVPFRFWLLRIATNAVNRWARRRRRRVTETAQVAELADAATVRSSTDGGLDVERAQRALLSLPPKYQAVLSLHYLEGLALGEVATVIGCRVGTVKSRLARAREALGAALSRRR